MRGTVIALAAAVAVAAAPARAGEKPPPMEDIGVTEQVGGRIPVDLPFQEAGGDRVRLGDYFGDGKPVVLVLAYVRCKMLCSLVLRGTANAVSALDRVPGEDYRVVTVSIDPRETPPQAAGKRRELLKVAGYPGEPERWPYLLGKEDDVRALAASLGFEYAWDPRSEQYAHPAVIFVLTPDGTIARYLHGIEFPVTDLRPALAKAAKGETGSQSASVAQSVLSCFRFDPALREYRGTIRRYFRSGAVAVFSVLGSLVVVLFLWERRRRK